MRVVVWVWVIKAIIDGTNYSSISSTEVKQYKELEKENYRLKQIMADLELDKRILKEALDFLGHKA